MRRKRKQKDEFLPELAKYSHMHPPLSPRFVRMTQPPMCSGEDMEKYFEMYIKTAPRGTERALLSPAQAEDVSAFPPTYIEAAQFDCLRDEAAAFAERLREAGVPVQLFEIKGAMHGYDIARRAEFLKPIMKRRAEFLRGVFNQKTK